MLKSSIHRLVELYSDEPLPERSLAELRLITLAGLLIFVGGLMFRLIYAFQIRDMFGHVGNRFLTVQGIAENLLRTGFYSVDGVNPNVSEEPVFPVVIAFSRLLPGPPWLSYLSLQIAIAAVGAWAVYRICMLYSASRPHACLTAAVFFAHPYLASQSVGIADTQLFASVLALTASSWLVLQERNTRRSAVSAGCCLALCFLVRNTTLVVLPTIGVCFLITMWTENWDGWEMRVRRLALAAAVTLFMITPWGLRNLYLTGHFIIATHGTAEFAIGNNPATYKTLASDISVDSIDIDPGKRLLEIADVRFEPGTPKHRVLYERLLARQGIQWAFDYPDEFLALIPLRLRKMWTWNLTPKFDYRGELVPNYALKARVMRSFLLPLTLLAVLAFLHPAAWNRGTVFCVSILIFFSGATSLVFGFTRLRAPFDTFLIIPAVQSALWLLSRVSLWAR